MHKVGLLGAGYICEAHARAVVAASGVELAAVCDRSLPRAEEAARRFGIARVYSSLQDMLASDVDVVHVLLPADAHIGPTRQVLEAGKHALVEKPMGLAAAECRELAALAHENGVRLAVNHNFLFLPAVEKLRADAADGTLGRIDRLSLNWLYPLGSLQFGPYDNWMLREPRNLFFELGPHLVSLMLEVAGKPEELRAMAGRPIDLPGGGRVYRQWQVMARRGDTAIDLTLSVVPGMIDRSIVARGHAAVAKADLERDLYLREEPSGQPLMFDNLLGPLSAGAQVLGGAGRTFARSLAGTLRKAPEANPFTLSIARLVAEFYRTLDTAPDSRLQGELGADVIETCERIVESAGVSSTHRERSVSTAGALPARPTVLVIGGTGFIGKHLVRGLVREGIGVRVATRSVAPARIALEGLDVEVVAGDLADPVFLDAALEGVETVYHLAKSNGRNWDDYYRQDVLVTKNIAERALAMGIRRFIYTGTIDSYFSGRASDVITCDTPLDERLESRNLYARSKGACEAMLMELHRGKKLPLVIMRPGIVIGEGCAPAHWGVGKFMADTRVQFWGDGRHALPFVLVEDVADALLRARTTPGIEGQCFLITDAPLMSGREYVEAVSQASGTRLRADSVPIWRYYVGDLLKEAVKHLIRHPNRRVPTYRDWASRSHRARYDSVKTREMLGWRPAGTRAALVERGIVLPVRESMR
jgi:predicted dehydrogenase/nucleoside-diphosphate-sugar epimerase